MWNLDHLLYTIEYQTTICTKEVMATAYANYSVLYPISAVDCVRLFITELLDERRVELIPSFLPFPLIFIAGIYRSVPLRH